jgi:hypothetical protein
MLKPLKPLTSASGQCSSECGPLALDEGVFELRSTKRAAVAAVRRPGALTAVSPGGGAVC